MESDSSGPRRHNSLARSIGAFAALLVFLTWAAAAYAAVGSDPSPAQATASATSELVSNMGPAARLGALLVAGFLPAIYLIARAGRLRRPTGKTARHEA